MFLSSFFIFNDTFKYPPYIKLYVDYNGKIFLYFYDKYNE